MDLSETSEAQASRFHKLAQIPFVQLEIVFGNDERIPSFSSDCYFEGIVRRSFQRPDILPVGKYVRVASDCTTARQQDMVEISPGVRINPDRRPMEQDLREGALVQMHLLPAEGPPDGFSKIGELIVVHRLSSAPVDDRSGEEYRANHLNDYNLLDENGPFGPGIPPAFPTQDVVLVYRDSAQPGKLFKADFQGSMWRVRIEQIQPTDVRVPAVIDDAFARTETFVWDNSRTYAIQSTSWQTRFGKVIAPRRPIFDVQGMDQIAGYPCTEYYVHSNVPRLDTAHACMTNDGVVLRHSHLDGSLSEVVSVSYERVSRSQVTLPVDYKPHAPE